MTYHATAERHGRFWLVHVKEVDRWTQGRTLAEAEEMARDLVAVMRNVEPDKVDVVLERRSS